jgi:hypothetical protein
MQCNGFPFQTAQNASQSIDGFLRPCILLACSETFDVSSQI